MKTTKRTPSAKSYKPPRDEEDSMKLLSETRLDIIRYVTVFGDWYHEKNPTNQSTRQNISKGTELQNQLEEERKSLLIERRKQIILKNTFYPPTAKQMCRYKEDCFRVSYIDFINKLENTLQ
jgi:hypothetical protein